MKVTFFFPYKLVSGVPVLFSNLALYFAENLKLDVTIVDYEDGYMSSRLNKNKKIKKIIFKDGENILISTNYLVLQSILPFGMRPELKISQDTKVLFWNLHPDNLIINLYPINFIKNYNFSLYQTFVKFFSKKKYNEIKKFISDNIISKNLVFMDSSNYYHTVKFYEIEDSKEISYVPIASSNNNFKKTINSKPNEIINFSWVGRICDFKINSLNFLIKNLSYVSVNLKQKIKLHIIGSGDKEKDLNYNNFQNDYFSITKLGTLSKEKLDEYLYENININASMGTSALESAKFGIPTIVLDFSYNKINENYSFRWLEDTINFDLGHFITHNDYLKNITMNNIIDNYKNDYESLSKNVYEYYQKNHSLDAVANNLVIALKKSKSTFSEINPYLLRKGIVRRLYERIKYRTKNIFK